MIGWKLDHIGMSPSAESYLVLHRFGPVRTAQQRAAFTGRTATYVDAAMR